MESGEACAAGGSLAAIRSLKMRVCAVCGVARPHRDGRWTGYDANGGKGRGDATSDKFAALIEQRLLEGDEAIRTERHLMCPNILQSDATGLGFNFVIVPTAREDPDRCAYYPVRAQCQQLVPREGRAASREHPCPFSSFDMQRLNAPHQRAQRRAS
jgi:hypothetical protein